MESVPVLDCAGPPSLAGDPVQLPRWSPTAQPASALPGLTPTVEEIIAVMRAAGENPEGVRVRGVIVVLWRAGLRVSEALALAETDLDAAPRRCHCARGQGRPATR